MADVGSSWSGLSSFTSGTSRIPEVKEPQEPLGFSSFLLTHLHWKHCKCDHLFPTIPVTNAGCHMTSLEEELTMINWNQSVDVNPDKLRDFKVQLEKYTIRRSQTSADLFILHMVQMKSNVFYMKYNSSIVEPYQNHLDLITHPTVNSGFYRRLLWIWQVQTSSPREEVPAKRREKLVREPENQTREGTCTSLMAEISSDSTPLSD